MKTLVSLYFIFFFIVPICAQQGFVVDHNHTDLSQIPNEWINAAKTNLKIRYFRRSHGSQIDKGGMSALTNYSAEYNSKYAFSKLDAAKNNNDVLYLSTQASNEWNSLDFENDTWVAITRNYLDDVANADINVIMWAWSSDFWECSATQYVNDMEMLIGEYGPGGSKILSGERTVPVTFVFQTACGQQSSERNRLVYAGNQIIREHCSSYNRILFDFRDLENYDPDGNYYGDGNPDGTYTSIRMLGDDLSYESDSTNTSYENGRGNWGLEWMNRNPSSELTALANNNICQECAHSDRLESNNEDNSRLHCVLKGKAAWWLWARLAGWLQEKDATITSSVELSESNLDGATITITVSGDMFVDDNLLNTNFQLNGAPTGTSVASITYINNQTAQLSLNFDGTDFDTNHDLSVTILASELQDGENITSNTLSIEAIDESQPGLQISSSKSLNENNLDGSVVQLQLSNEEFSGLQAQHLTLQNAPEGCTVASISDITATTCNVVLAFTGIDFDDNVTNFRILVDAEGLVGTANLLSNAIAIEAIIEVYSAILTSATDLIESDLDGAIVHLELVNQEFVNFNVQHLELQNAPAGCTISAIDNETADSCDVELSFDHTDFDADITNFRIRIDAAGLNGSQNLVTNAISIEAVMEGAAAELTSDVDLIESGLNGSTLYITLTEDTFVTDNRSNGDFTLQNAPQGLSVGEWDIVSDTEAQLPLVFDGTDFMEDITNFSVLIAKELLTGNIEITTNSITIEADIAQAIDEADYSGSIKLYPNPGNGLFSIEFGQQLGGNFLLKVISTEGKCVFEKYINQTTNNKLDFDLQKLNPGNYFLVLNNEQRRFVKTLIIEK
jgi:hypothetical protein